MNTIKLPALYCPFPSAINQHCEAAGQHSLEWARSFSLVKDESAIHILRVAKFHVLAARTNPNISLETLEIISDYLVWGFIGDDQFEGAGTSKQPELLETIHTRLVDIVKGAFLTDVDTPAARALQDIRQRLLQHGTPFLMLRFAKNLEDFLQGVRWEAVNHSQEITPDLTTYMKIRASTVGPIPFVTLC